MQKIFKIFFFIGVIILAVQPGCEKRPKCGCDGDVRFTLDEKEGTIIYNEESSYAEFQPSNVYSQFEICNPGEFMDRFKQYEQGEPVLVSGDAFDDCYKMYNPYASASYMLELKEIKKDEFSQ